MRGAELQRQRQTSIIALHIGIKLAELGLRGFDYARDDIALLISELSLLNIHMQEKDVIYALENTSSQVEFGMKADRLFSIIEDAIDASSGDRVASTYAAAYGIGLTDEITFATDLKSQYVGMPFICDFWEKHAFSMVQRSRAFVKLPPIEKDACLGHRLAEFSTRVEDLKQKLFTQVGENHIQVSFRVKE